MPGKKTRHTFARAPGKFIHEQYAKNTSRRLRGQGRLADGTQAVCRGACPLRPGSIARSQSQRGRETGYWDLPLRAHEPGRAMVLFRLYGNSRQRGRRLRAGVLERNSEGGDRGTHFEAARAPRSGWENTR